MSLEHKNYGMTGNLTDLQDKDIYIEEISNGRAFLYKNEIFITTTDSKKDFSRLCISVTDGSCRWFKANTIVKTITLYYLNKDNNIISIYEKNNTQ